jgi:hypothetical protein
VNGDDEHDELADLHDADVTLDRRDLLRASTTAELCDELHDRFVALGLPGLVSAVNELRDELTDVQLAYRPVDD